MKQLYLAFATLLTLSFIGACVTKPHDSGLLTQARSAVSQAESDPNVAKYAPTDLERARRLLTNAEGAAKEKGAENMITAHYAYLATQMAHISEQRAHEQVATERIKSGEVERQQILLTARENEAQNAQADAVQARNEAQNAQSQAVQARNEAQNAQSQTVQAQGEAQRLAAQLENMQAAQTDRGIVLTLSDVLFDTGRAQLKPGADRSIEQLAAFLNEHPERRVQVEGFTDSQGTDDYNLELSQKRADSVAMAIIQRGIDAQRVRALGFGEAYPKASNGSAGSRQLNRRVEIIVSNGDREIPGRAGSSSP